jgi:hypothetical protein
MNICNTWMTHGGLEKVAEFASELPDADELGFVYVLSLSNNTRKIGRTGKLHQRLRTNETEMSRYGVAIQFCSITRPHFNFRTVERNALRWLNVVGTREILPEPHETVCEAVAAQHMELTAPTDFVARHQTSVAYINSLMRDIGARLGIEPQAEITRSANLILEAHTELGRLTGLSEADSLLNALAVIECQTGLKLSQLRDVLTEVA